jgi:hypothetical protein
VTLLSEGETFAEGVKQKSSRHHQAIQRAHPEEIRMHE